MTKMIEVIEICDEDGNGQLRMPSSLKAYFKDILQPYADAEAADDHGGLAPFLSIDDFKALLGSDDEVLAAMDDVSRAADDHDRMLTVAWSLLPDWAKSVSAFEQRWKVRLADPALQVSHGYVRGRVPAAFGP